jgi:carboxymethylenebutenolidase
MRRSDGSAKVSRRSILGRSLSAGLGAALLSAGELHIVEADVPVQTQDGTCDAVLFHPPQGAHPGILLWPDAGGLREAFRELGRRVAAQGYAVLVPNHLYRSARPPIFPADFDPPKKPADRRPTAESPPLSLRREQSKGMPSRMRRSWMGGLRSKRGRN